MFVDLLILSIFFTASFGETGLQRAGAYYILFLVSFTLPKNGYFLLLITKYINRDGWILFFKSIYLLEVNRKGNTVPVEIFCSLY